MVQLNVYADAHLIARRVIRRPEREGKYEQDGEELGYKESGNMPEWAEDDPRGYWAAADAHERANGRLYRQVESALPRELNAAERVELATRFAEHLTAAERLPYTLAVHRGGQDGGNPHAHQMISERANDGIERSAEKWFKRYNAKEPEKGGARKSTSTKPWDWLEQPREDWADQANEALEREGWAERITEASLENQYFEAAEAGDIAVERPVSQTAPAQIPACRFPAPGSSEVLASASGLRRMKPPAGPGLGAARAFVARVR